MSVGLVIDNHIKSLLSSNCFTNIKIRMIGFEGCFKNCEFDEVSFHNYSPLGHCLILAHESDTDTIYITLLILK